MSELRDRALELMDELSAGEKDPLEAGTRLEEIGFDSLALAELATALEDEFGIDVGDPLLDGTAMVRDLLEIVDRADVARSTLDVPPGVGRLQRLADVLG